MINLNRSQKLKYNKAMRKIEEWLPQISSEVKRYGFSPDIIEIKNVEMSKAKCRHAYVNRASGLLNISEHMFEVPEEELVTTLLHEMCHMYKCANDGHGPKWKLVAMCASEVSGLEITRCRNIEGVDDDWKERREKLVEKSGLVFKCRDCGQVITRTRRSRFTENYTRYRCGKCGGHFDKVTRSDMACA